MSNQQNPPKSPYQSNRGSPHNQSEANVCLPRNPATTNDPSAPNPATRSTQREKLPALNTTTKNRSAIPTPSQSQSTKPPANGTPANSLACVPREKTNRLPLRPAPTQRPLPTRDKPSPIFNPAATSTPKSSPIRERQPPAPVNKTVTAQQTTQPGPNRRVQPLPPPQDGRQLCLCPLAPASVAGLPRNAVNLTEICVPAELVDRAPNRLEAVRGERILKLEILAISGGTLYDLDRIHQQTTSTTTPGRAEPTYDPRFDIDRMEASKHPKDVAGHDSDVETYLSSECGSKESEHEPGVHEDDTTLEPRSSDDKTTLVRDTCTLSRSESNIFPDSTLTGPPAAPKKQMWADNDDEHDVLRSAPAAPAPYNLSDLSLTDMSAVRYEKEDEAALVLSTYGGEQPSFADGNVEMGDVSIPREQMGLAGDSVEMGEVSIPRQQRGFADNTVEMGEVSIPRDESKRREADKPEQAGRKSSRPNERTGEADGKRCRGGERGADTREKGTKPKYEPGGKADNMSGTGQQSNTRENETDTRDGVRSDPSSGIAGRTAAENGQALPDETSDDRRGSISLILGPSVRNFAHLALSPLTSLRAFLGPAPNARPMRKNRFRNDDNSVHPKYVRIKSLRSAFVVTPYEAAALSFGYFLRRHHRKRTKKNGSTESESSSDSE